MPKKLVLLASVILLLFCVNPKSILAYDKQQIATAALLVEIDWACEGQQRDEQMLLAQSVSNTCRTPSMICVLSQYGPVGAPCWCIGPYGPIAGVLVR